MYLTLLAVNARSRAAQRDLANRYELHRTVMCLFPGIQSSNARIEGQVLYRCDLRSDGRVSILIQSSAPPNGSALAPDYLDKPLVPKELEPFLESLKAGDMLRFKLEANASKRDIRTGKRVEVRGDEAQQAWLERQASRHGFELVRAGSGVADARTQAAPKTCLLYTSPSPRDRTRSRMPSSA